MNRRTFTMIAAAVSFAFGVIGIVAPEPLAALYGFALTPHGVALARLLAAAYLGYAVVNWLARDVRDPAAQRAIASGNCVGWGLSFAVGTIALAQGLSNAVGVSNLVMQAIFAVSWGYFALARTGAMRPTTT